MILKFLRISVFSLALISQLASGTDFSFACDLALSNPPVRTPSYGLQIKKFASGDLNLGDLGNLQMETQLKESGIDLISIENPSEAEIQAGRAAGYLFVPHEILWVGYVSSILQNLRVAKTDMRSIFDEKLSHSQDRVRVEIGPLTVNDFRQWHKIYQKEVIERNRSHLKIEASWAANLGDMLTHHQRIFFYDEITGHLLGGAILNTKDRNVLHLIFEAFKAEAQDLDLEARAFYEMLTYASANRFANFYYLRDSNLYGRYLPVSTVAERSKLGLQFATSQDRHLLKVLNLDILQRDFLIFAFTEGLVAPHHFTSQPRDLGMELLVVSDPIVHDLRKTAK